MTERVWEFVEPGDDGNPVVYRWTDGQVLGFYWDWWSNMMRERGKRGINPERCIQDWAVVNWAVEVQETKGVA